MAKQIQSQQKLIILMADVCSFSQQAVDFYQIIGMQSTLEFPENIERHIHKVTQTFQLLKIVMDPNHGKLNSEHQTNIKESH
jgi:uncharacterized membrane protein